MVHGVIRPNISRLRLDRHLCRHWVCNLRDQKPAKSRPSHPLCKTYLPSCLPQVANDERRLYFFMAIDRATRWIFVCICLAKSVANACHFVRSLRSATPMKVANVIANNENEFSGRHLGFHRRSATGNRDFGRLCCRAQHRTPLALPTRPQAEGLAERLNDWSHRFAAQRLLLQRKRPRIDNPASCPLLSRPSVANCRQRSDTHQSVQGLAAWITRAFQDAAA